MSFRITLSPILTLGVLFTHLSPAPADEKPAKSTKDAKVLRQVRMDRLLCAEVKGHFEVPTKGFELTLDRAEFLAGKVNRWHFTCWNKTEKDLVNGIAKETYLTDEKGERYPLLSASLLGDAKDWNVKAGGKLAFTIDFATPQNSASVYTLNLSSNLAYPRFHVHIPWKELPATPPEPLPEERIDQVKKTITPPPKAITLITRQVKDKFGVMVPYGVQFTKVELLENGDIRVHLAVVNSHTEKVPDHLYVHNTAKPSGMRDDRTGFFPLVGSSMGIGYVHAIHFNCAPGEKKEIWLEFAGPFKDRNKLLISMENAMGLKDIPLTLPVSK